LSGEEWYRIPPGEKIKVSIIGISKVEKGIKVYLKKI
jgi:hypothetical protein